MQPVDIDDYDLKGVFFCYYPLEQSFEESRERLEQLIYETADEIAPPVEIDDVEMGKDGKLYRTGKKFNINEPCLSQYWIYLALSHKNVQALREMPKDERRKAILAAWKDREARRMEILERANEAKTRAAIEEAEKGAKKK